MNLIDKLRDWGESLFSSKKAFVAHQALPQGNIGRVVVQLQNADGWTYTPPADGYLSADIFSADQVFLHSGLLSYVDAGDRKGVILPVRKGENVSVGSANYSQTSALYFFPLIGGGYLSSILQAIGGGLWKLSHLNRSFNRFSSSAVAKQCLQSMGQFGTLYQDNLELLSRRLMALYRSLETRRFLLSSLSSAELKHRPMGTMVSGRQSVLRSKRVLWLNTIPTDQGRKTLFSLRVSACLNPCLQGGAL